MGTLLRCFNYFSTALGRQFCREVERKASETHVLSPVAFLVCRDHHLNLQFFSGLPEHQAI